ncbi:hypothetical protein PC129_g4764 [Phytophthora cactorum]|uniref:Uncharacterized protein n=1 Tax=Phytophthora cactorum TaxID=29920 RepID=A0A8T1E583_9STRA|nr:hypothetical protein PC117_g6871 [Phytophthora cactorum]KAG3224595.1 hypothetical protein PC129_g4764 [Phytophthora cactorum]KAG4249997.1 hypothetical protein PC116_g2357 [Phytophthora cactorum]
MAPRHFKISKQGAMAVLRVGDRVKGKTMKQEGKVETVKCVY